jgi:hypothetical protein
LHANHGLAGLWVGLCAALLGACAKPPEASARAGASAGVPAAAAGSAAAGASGAPPAASGVPPPSGEERDRAIVRVRDVDEIWRLVWREPPKDACSTDDERRSCPCDGARFGQEGRIALVRERPGRGAEVLELGERRLPRYPEHEAERGRGVSEIDLDEVRRRPPVRLLDLGDYDRDGGATEFVLRAPWAGPCGHIQAELVGVSRGRDELHAFGTAERPGHPLVLQGPRAWEALRREGRVESTVMGCGDHGWGYDDVLVVRAEGGGLHAEVARYLCVDLRRSKPPFFRRGARVFARAWDPDDPEFSTAW